ncbi:MAG: glycosyltransferase [Phycisphaerales bacterium]|nr:glycosyltransferase [Phycisphaerales bacterium]
MTDERPLVSIVIPTCNRPDLTRRCLAALAVQTYAPYELIVVDDGSDDDTPDVIAAFGADNPAVTFRHHRHDTNLGANRSRERGILDARGSIVAFLDSDCIAEPDWLERLMAGFDSEDVAAVTGLIRDPEPTNIYELTFKGTHRMGRPGNAHRLVAGNMAVRRDVLMTHRFDHDRAETARTKDGRIDTTVSGRGDEEGLSLKINAAGLRMRTVPDAAVFHEHYYTRRSFYRQAVRGGRSAARLVYKYHLAHRIDMLPFIATYLTVIPAVIIGLIWTWWAMLVPAFFLAMSLAAITYNDVARKGKTIGEVVRSFPTLLAYYHVRLWGYCTETVALWMGRRSITRERLPSATAESS